MRLVVEKSPDMEVLLDGVKIDCFEADDEQGKVWITADNHQGYEVRKGNVEFRQKINLQNTARGEWNDESFSNPCCVFCNGLRDRWNTQLYDLRETLKEWNESKRIAYYISE